MTSAYQHLEQAFARVNAIRGASSMLQWDSATMMPSGSSPVRAEQMAALAELSHEHITNPRLAEWLAQAEADRAALDEWQQANLREMRRVFLHENAVPTELVGELSRACSASESCWREARKRNDFKTLLPLWKTVLERVREVAQAKADALGLSLYDALLDQYDPGTRSGQIDVWFEDLGTFLPGFTQEVLEHQRRQPAPSELRGPFSIQAQRTLGRRFMEVLGFDFTRGRLDESAHPFCGGVPGDVRLTTRYREENLTESLYGVFHETGHALYEMGLPEAWRTQPVGEARGMSMHESQSLLTEMQLCRSRDFLTYAAPLIAAAFGGTGEAWSTENLARLATRVTPSLIRVSADEVTYPSHVILRYRLERLMIEGSLELDDLPGAWKDGMQALLGIAPKDDADGCMQDIHWPDGAFGYFPTYTLGAMIAAQLFAAARAQMADLAGSIQRGDFTSLREWLGANVHRWGSRYSTDELLTKATGAPLSTEGYKAHLRRRYLGE